MNNNAASNATRTSSSKVAFGLTSRDFVILAMLVALEIILGLWNIPMPAGLSITFNMIPVAIAAIAIGPKGGAIIGGAFGLISFLQCFGIMGSSGLGIALMQEGANPILMFVHRFGSRFVDGLLLGYIFRALRGRCNVFAACSVTGFFAAFLNTLLFMSTLVLFFSNTAKMQQSMAGRAFFAYIVASVGVNGLIEMAVSTILTGAVGTALHKAGFVHTGK
jgi:uncharacterized membrane protein